MSHRSRQPLLAGLVIGTLHFVLTLGLFVLAFGLDMSDFDGGPTFAGRVGRALEWGVERTLMQPLSPLKRKGPPWDWARGYGGLLLNSGVWAAGGAAVAALRRRRASTAPVGEPS
jgi:hypothetical protein